MNEKRVAIPGSEYEQAAGTEVTPIAADRVLTVSIILRPDPDVAAAVPDMEEFAKQYGLEVTEADAAKRTVKVRGTVAQLEAAFGVQLGQYGDHIGYRGPITVPTLLVDKILAVLGLDTRAIARPR